MTEEVQQATVPAKATVELFHEIALRSPFDGWKATMQVRRVPARVLVELQSGQFQRQLNTVQKLVREHNFVDEATGKPLEDLADAPIEAVTMLVELWGETVASIPNV